ncbi:hypothetical protein TVAG_318170 [Trichomonas vaginalis G3]|uniref:Uncharacterized protein n=1 Tax=Trichomonas vaginalis (strain ATCC PRA-98 / G3) TaxID=412133 RepID=A2G427_TRIV3|nr:guanylate cyclase protein [Trichomonas vaginalis G3]EAX88092.1 hypothetical protein TVAG_318170 [Trichomonas vaginalis G3]KAI5495772.1 guanylate cyclase protein [Trichomonas vaginalis G3]|eukprot:XP_001301022.1 hypothetical protein [Trichomonas vaginalis G3]
MGYSNFFVNVANFYILTGWAKSAGRYTEDTSVLGDLHIDANNVNLIVDQSLTFAQAIYSSMTKSRVFLRVVLDSLVNMAREQDIYRMAADLLKPTSPIVVCDQGYPIIAVNGTLSQLIYFLNFEEAEIAGTYGAGETIPNLFTDTTYCQVQMNTFASMDISQGIFMSFIGSSSGSTIHFNHIFKLWLICGSVIFLILVIVPISIIVASYLKMINRVLKILLNLPQKSREEAKQNLFNEQLESSEDKFRGNKQGRSLKIIICYINQLCNNDRNSCFICFDV